MFRKTIFPANSDWHNFINYDYWYGEKFFVENDKERYFEWNGTDNADFFNNQINDGEWAKELIQYVDNPIKYHVNKNHFRTPFEFDDTYEGEVDVALGCSMTFGTGMYNDYIWPSVVERATKVPIINLGSAGAGVDQAYINLQKVLDKFKVRKVFHYHQIFGRAHAVVFTYKQENVFASTQYSKGYRDHAKDIWKEKYFQEVITSEGNILFEHKRAIDAIMGLCLSRDIGYYYFNTCNWMPYFALREGKWGTSDVVKFNKVCHVTTGDTIARDILHPSRYQHEAIANRFIEVMDKRDTYIEPFYDRWQGHYNPIGARLL